MKQLCNSISYLQFLGKIVVLRQNTNDLKSCRLKSTVGGCGHFLEWSKQLKSGTSDAKHQENPALLYNILIYHQKNFCLFLYMKYTISSQKV